MPYVGHNTSATPRRIFVAAQPRTSTQPLARRRAATAAVHIGIGALREKPTAAPGVRGGITARRVSTQSLGAYAAPALDDLEGWSLKGIVKGIKKIASPVQKAAASVGHTVGKVATSKLGQAVLGTALAVTGVGAPAAAAIFATTKGVGNLIKPGGNLKHAVTGAAQGAVEGVVSAEAGNVVRRVASRFTSGSTAAPASTPANPGPSVDTSGPLANPQIPGVANPIPQVPTLPTVAPATLPADTTAETVAAARAAAQQQIDAANQAAAAAQAQLQNAQTAAAKAAAQQQIDAANQAAAAAEQAAQARIDAANQAAAQSASASAPAANAFADDSAGGGHIPTPQELADEKAADDAAAAAAQARSASTKKLLIGAAIVGAGGVMLVARKHAKRKR